MFHNEILFFILIDYNSAALTPQKKPKNGLFFAELQTRFHMDISY